MTDARVGRYRTARYSDKICPKCERPGVYSLHAKAPDGLQPFCVPCATAMNKVLRRKNPAKYILHASKSAAKRKGYMPLEMSEDELNAYISERVDACDLCGDSISGENENGRVRWRPDHDHQTGKLRGFLCNMCNVVMGHVDKNPNIIDAIVAYLEKPPAQHERN